MAKRLLITLYLLSCFINVFAGYGQQLCKQYDWLYCIRIKSGQSWEKLWSNPYHRDLIKRINRTNLPLYPGMVIAVPRDLSMDPIEVAPLAKQIRPMGENTIVVALSVLAWGAYTPDGRLVRWGPLSGGKDYCEDIDGGCRTKTGVYYIYEKRGPECVSTKFPLNEGGAPMPYCMFYFGGYALHGSPAVPGYHASHGCVRLFTEDARWLNRVFSASDEKTLVIVLPYESGNESRF